MNFTRHRFMTSTAFSLILAMGIVSPGLANTIAIIGTGNVAQALGPEFAALGHQVVYGSRNPDRDDVHELVARTGDDASATDQQSAAAQAEIILLAVPWTVVEEVVGNLGDLAGKIVVDPTNPRREMEDGLLYFGLETSNAQRIQDMAPAARVVKAFNTMAWPTMVDPASSGGPVSVPLAGNDTEAKAVVAELVRGLGLEPFDVGPVRNAHLVEGMYLLWRNGINMGTHFNFHMRRGELPVR